MTYGRMRDRNGLAWRPDPGSDAVYPPPGVGTPLPSTDGLIGDLSRMERDYLDPPAELIARCGDRDPASEVADATGVHVETVRTVLTHVFREQR